MHCRITIVLKHTPNHPHPLPPAPTHPHPPPPAPHPPHTRPTPTPTYDSFKSNFTNCTTLDRSDTRTGKFYIIVNSPISGTASKCIGSNILFYFLMIRPGVRPVPTSFISSLLPSSSNFFPSSFHPFFVQPLSFI